MAAMLRCNLPLSATSARNGANLSLSTGVKPEARISGGANKGVFAGSCRMVAPRKDRFVMAAAAVPVLTWDGEKVGEAELDLRSARPETARAVVHRATVLHLQNKRRGTASTLTRGEVRGGGRKPFKQKGTGRARQGSTRTPLKPGGGVVFGPKPKDWTIKINRKERLLAVSTALQSASVNIAVIEDLNEAEAFSEKPKTKEMVEALRRWGIDYKEDNTLLISSELSPNVQLSCRNIEKLQLTQPDKLNVYQILRADKLLVTRSALERLTERFGAREFELEGEEIVGEVQVEILSSPSAEQAAEEKAE
eukprot:TRINITY_DN150_c0_g1_i1.p1 TRINITY_DN150_c0_g1~~TRINITY_DN150_c0_g1_i1.p1  ORF type:complete len:327 (-),score=61.23 TRINITY_DN150_c0_g1_i1:455-1378(-)